MRRLFWFGAGVAAGVALSRKASETARKATPSGMADQLGDAMRELAAAVGSFGADVRAGMSERESELNDTVAQRPNGTVAQRADAGSSNSHRSKPDGASWVRAGASEGAARRARRAGC